MFPVLASFFFANTRFSALPGIEIWNEDSESGTGTKISTSSIFLFLVLPLLSLANSFFFLVQGMEFWNKVSDSGTGTKISTSSILVSCFSFSFTTFSFPGSVLCQEWRSGMKIQS